MKSLSLLLLLVSTSAFAQANLGQFTYNRDIKVLSTGIAIIDNNSKYAMSSDANSKTVTSGSDYRVEWTKDPKSGELQILEALREPGLYGGKAGSVQLARAMGDKVQSYSNCLAKSDGPNLRGGENRELGVCVTTTREVCAALERTIGIHPVFVAAQTQTCDAISEAKDHLSKLMREPKYLATVNENNLRMVDGFSRLSRPNGGAAKALQDSDKHGQGAVPPGPTDWAKTDKEHMTLELLAVACYSHAMLEVDRGLRQPPQQPPPSERRRQTPGTI